MKTFIQPGKVLQMTAPYTVVSGAGTLLGTMFGVAATDVTSGAVGEYMMTGVHNLAKASGAWSQGDAIYWDDTAKNCTKTTTSNTKIGVAAKVGGQASGDTTGYVRLNGAF